MPLQTRTASLLARVVARLGKSNLQGEPFPIRATTVITINSHGLCLVPLVYPLERQQTAVLVMHRCLAIPELLIAIVGHAHGGPTAQHCSHMSHVHRPRIGRVVVEFGRYSPYHRTSALHVRLFKFGPQDMHSMYFYSSDTVHQFQYTHRTVHSPSNHPLPPPNGRASSGTHGAYALYHSHMIMATMCASRVIKH